MTPLCPRILLAHSRDAERELLGYVLKMEGFSVVLPETADEGLSLARSGEVDLMLIDAVLLRSDSHSYKPVAEDRPLLGSLPLIVLGQPRDKEEVVRLLRNGAREWVAENGFTVEMLLGKVQTALRAVTKEASAKAEVDSATTKSADVVVSKQEIGNLSAEQILQALDAEPSLGSFEFTLAQAMTRVSGSDSSKHLANVLARDPLVTITVLSQVKLEDEIIDPARLVSQMDASWVHRVLESVVPLEPDHESPWDAGHFWVHSVATSRIAGLIADRIGLTNMKSTAEVAGLVHDVGYCVLATCFPKHYQYLWNQSRESGTLGDLWESEMIGINHGDIGRLFLKHKKLPNILQDVVSTHDAPSSVRQSLSARSRLAIMIVQAADRIADAVFPGTPYLSTISCGSEEFEEAVRRAGLNVADLVSAARKIVAELFTEMCFEFPQTAKRTERQPKKPFDTVTYYAPNPRKVDIVRVFLETRSHKVITIDRIREGMINDATPMVVNLEHINDVSAQIESLSSVMAAGLMVHRRGLVLLPGRVQEVHSNLITNTWMAQSVPTHPAYWTDWLTKPIVASSADADALVA